MQLRLGAGAAAAAAAAARAPLYGIRMSHLPRVYVSRIRRSAGNRLLFTPAADRTTYTSVVTYNGRLSAAAAEWVASYIVASLFRLAVSLPTHSRPRLASVGYRTVNDLY
jgi:hypothetical protein